MGLDALLVHLEDEARAQAEAVLGAAREQARELRERAEAELGRELEARLAARRRALEAADRASLSELVRASRRSELEARERLLTRVFGAAAGALEALGAEPGTRLAEELAQALVFVTPPVTIRCHADLGEAMSAAARAVGLDRGAVEVVADDGCGAGFIVTGGDGAITVDATLAARLLRARPALSIEIVATLEATT